MTGRSITVAVLIASLSAISSLRADDVRDTTVALTVAVYNDAGPAERDLTGALLALLELQVSAEPGLGVVERRQIDLALQELALSKDLGRNAAAKAQLGKIASADLIVTLELLKPEEDAEAYQVLIRIVESLTGRIRGVSVASMRSDEIDEAAGQISRYLTIVNRSPESPPVTVAVAPFESKGRFDRLRPLELGLRDMVATRLRKWSRVIGKDDPEKSVLAFQVLQRSNMAELLRELDLIQAGLVDASRLPKSLPNRAAAFLVRGEVDERNDGGVFSIVVSGELVHAATNKVAREFTFETTPDQLEQRLAHAVNLLAGRLITSQGEVSDTPGPLRELHEIDSLFGRVASDLKRFQRIRPTDFSYRYFELPGRIRASGSRIIRAEDPLGVALLKKSIDRLESILFIRPDHGGAAYALAFCHSYHFDGIVNLDRAQDLLKRAAGTDPDGPLGAAALRLLAEVNYHHRKGRVVEGREAAAVDQLQYAFINMPEEHRDVVWSRVPSKLSESFASIPDHAITMKIIEFAAVEAEREGGKYQYQIALGVGSLVESLSARKDQSDGYSGMAVLERWGDSDDLTLKRVAAWSLAHLALRKRDYEAAAGWYLSGAEVLASGTSRADQLARDNFRIHAARSLRRAGNSRSARELLESFQPGKPETLNTAYHAIELAQCLIDDKENDKALELLVSTAERVPGMRDNTPVERLVRDLGGVPLREDSDIEVEYLKWPKDIRLYLRALATDGTRLFCGGGFAGGIPRGVVVYNPNDESWEVLSKDFGRVTDLDFADGALWVGTEKDGVWRLTMTGRKWTQIAMAQGLPDDRVSRVAAHDGGVFAGLGTTASGGVVRVNKDGQVTVLDGQDAPTVAPQSLVVQGNRLLVATGSAIHEFDLAGQVWTRLLKTGGLRVFRGSEHAWTSKYGREIAPYGADDQAAEHFKPAWYSEKTGRSGYKVEFCLEHKGQVWFGGFPWARFRSCGFYRFDPKTAEFRMYNLRDGFRMSTTYSTHAGVVIGDDMWIATSGGLARVTPRVAETGE